jgi:hypothetical protein
MTALSTAKIYTFPPRGRFALRMDGGAIVPPANFELPQGAEFAVGGGAWYHDEAVQDEQHGQPTRKN